MFATTYDIMCSVLMCAWWWCVHLVGLGCPYQHGPPYTVSRIGFIMLLYDMTCLPYLLAWEACTFAPDSPTQLSSV
eukprot:803984-Amphidinium_carterae.1